MMLKKMRDKNEEKDDVFVNNFLYNVKFN